MTPMKRRMLKAGALLVALGMLGFVGAASGVVPIKASSGHFAITRIILQFGKERSVATHTIGLSLPPLGEHWQVLKGAGHYETACRPCHGSPDLPLPTVPQAMTPAPPYLPPRISKWQPEELFYMVKHGIKFTGMPAWPAQQRDDEVRAMVAFLLELPDMDAEEYRALVFGDLPDSAPVAAASNLLGAPEPPPPVLSSCARCHGRDGNGRGAGAFPRLAGQREPYLFNSLRAYARGERHSGVMQPIATGLREHEMRALAEYYARLPGAGASASAQAGAGVAAIERGRRIAAEGIADRRVPSCMDCHGPQGPRRRPAYPRLAGQYAQYLVMNLELFKAGKRGGTRYAHLMREVAPRLTAQQMRDVAAYYASLAPGEGD